MKRPEPGDVQRLETAAEWMLKLRDEGANEAEIRRWMQWSEEDARNHAAFERVQQVWSASAGLAGEVRDGELTGVAGGVHSRTLRVGVVAAALLDLLAGASLRRVFLATACVCGLLLGAGGLFLGVPAEPDRLTVTSARSIQKTQLADGSRVELAARSTVAVHYSEHHRALELQGGEAFFTVVPDERRPFVVSAGGIRVRAIGTAFNVRRSDDRVVVTVTEGTVDVHRVGGDKGGAAAAIARRGVRVSTGSQVTWEAKEKNPVVTAVNPTTVAAWREGRLEYASEPLAAVIADLNRYSERPVVVRGEAIKRLRFSGTLLTDSTEEWLRALPGQFPVTLAERDGGYVIEPREQPR